MRRNFQLRLTLVERQIGNGWINAKRLVSFSPHGKVTYALIHRLLGSVGNLPLL